MLRRRSQPDESIRKMKLAVASKFIDGVKNEELRTMLATHYTPLSTNAPTPEELTLKSKDNLLLKPPSRSGHYKNNYGNFKLVLSKMKTFHRNNICVGTIFAT